MMAQADMNRVLERLRTAASRSFGTGMLLRGGLHAASSALALMKKGKGTREKRTVGIIEALIDSLRTGALLASVASAYICAEEGISILAGKQETQGWRCLAAGVIAGVSIILAPKSGRSSLSTYIFLRGLTVLFRSLNKVDSSIPPLLHKILAVTRLDHGDTALMCLSASVILYCFIMQPEALPRSYVRWITRQGGVEPWVWQAIREQALNNTHQTPNQPLKMLRGTRFESITSHPPTPCHFWHPGKSCSHHVFGNLLSSFIRSLRVYAPVYVLPAIIVHRLNLLSKPFEIWPKVAAGVFRSSLFLTFYIALAFGGACAGFHLTGINTGPVIAASIWMGGLATLVEKPSRRLELALFSTSRALESLATALVNTQWIPSIPHIDVILFSAGCGMLMHCYGDNRGRHRDCFRSKYQSVIDFIFGSRGLDEGKPTHELSNRDLLRKILSITVSHKDQEGIMKKSASEPRELNISEQISEPRQ